MNLNLDHLPKVLTDIKQYRQAETSFFKRVIKFKKLEKHMFDLETQITLNKSQLKTRKDSEGCTRLLENIRKNEKQHAALKNSRYMQMEALSKVHYYLLKQNNHSILYKYAQTLSRINDLESFFLQDNEITLEQKIRLLKILQCEWESICAPH